MTLREDHRLRMFENGMLGIIFGTRTDEVTGGWKELHNEELITCTPSKHNHNSPVKEARVCSTNGGRTNMYIGYCWESQKGRYH
jgi:hypothetical protein